MAVDITEYPKDYKGRRSYVWVSGHGVVAAMYTYYQGGGRQVLPEYGGAPYESKATGSNLMVMRDIGEYTSVVDGTHISTRSAHRDHIRRHDLVEVGNQSIGSMDRPQDSGPRVGSEIQRTLHRAKQGY